MLCYMLKHYIFQPSFPPAHPPTASSTSSTHGGGLPNAAAHSYACPHPALPPALSPGMPASPVTAFCPLARAAQQPAALQPCHGATHPDQQAGSSCESSMHTYLHGHSAAIPRAHVPAPVA